VATAKTGTVFDSGTVRAVREASANLCALLEMEAQAKEDSARPSRKGKPTMENKEPTITRERIDAFIARVLSDTSKKINRTDFWLVAGYENRSEFERFQRDDPKTTKSAKRRFEEVLALDSTLFLERLKKTRS